MYSRHPPILICVCLMLPACGTTHRFVDQPKLTLDGGDATPLQATAALFDAVTPYRVTFCEADPVSKDCKKGSDGVRAHGVGGLFIPLVQNVSGMTVRKQSPSDAGWQIETAVESTADGIPPLCRTVHGQIRLRANDTITVQLPSFYCNWVAVGNVIVNADFSIDRIDAHNKVFNGFYKIVFHGTGNASGSGYYRAAVLPDQHQDSTGGSHGSPAPSLEMPSLSGTEVLESLRLAGASFSIVVTTGHGSPSVREACRCGRLSVKTARYACPCEGRIASFPFGALTAADPVTKLPARRYAE